MRISSDPWHIISGVSSPLSNRSESVASSGKAHLGTAACGEDGPNVSPSLRGSFYTLVEDSQLSLFWQLVSE